MWELFPLKIAQPLTHLLNLVTTTSWNPGTPFKGVNSNQNKKMWELFPLKIAQPLTHLLNLVTTTSWNPGTPFKGVNSLKLLDILTCKSIYSLVPLTGNLYKSPNSTNFILA